MKLLINWSSINTSTAQNYLGSYTWQGIIYSLLLAESNQNSTKTFVQLLLVKIFIYKCQVEFTLWKIGHVETKYAVSFNWNFKIIILWVPNLCTEIFYYQTEMFLFVN